MKKQYKGFTLVELIVVITILAILATIGFLGIQGYFINSRDSVRISDISRINTSLELFKISKGNYPQTSSGIEVLYSGAEVWTQGTFGKSVMTNVQKINKIPTDPLTGKEYIYSVLNTKKEFEVGSIFEGNLAMNNLIINNIHAASDDYIYYIKGTYNGLFAKVSTGSVNYVLSVPTIIGFDLSNNDLFYMYQNNKLLFNGFKASGGFEFNPSDIVVYTGSVDDLEDIGELKLFTQNLQNSYSGSSLSSVGIYSDILAVNPNDNNKISTIRHIINNNLGGNLDIPIPEIDETAPIISDPLPSGEVGLPDVNISVTTDELANCKYDEIETDYESMLNSFTTVDNISHTDDIVLETINTTYDIYVICRDMSDNESMLTTINFTYTVVADETAPIVSNPLPSGIVDLPDVTISVTTDESANCKYDEIETDYESMTNSFATADNMSHTDDIVLETIETIYNINVICRDLSDNDSILTVINFTYTVEEEVNISFDENDGETYTCDACY